MTGCRWPMDFDRSRKLTSDRIARKPALMLVPDRLTVKVCGAAASALRFNGLEGSLMIE